MGKGRRSASVLAPILDSTHYPKFIATPNASNGREGCVPPAMITVTAILQTQAGHQVSIKRPKSGNRDLYLGGKPQHDRRIVSSHVPACRQEFVPKRNDERGRLVGRERPLPHISRRRFRQQFIPSLDVNQPQPVRRVMIPKPGAPDDACRIFGAAGGKK